MGLPHDEIRITENPFFHRGPVRDRRYFYGRTDETRQALRMLRQGQCVSIVGPRFIGKTSFLFHLYDSEVQKEYSLGEYLFVYIHCQDLENLDGQQLYQWLSQLAKRAVEGRGKADTWELSTSHFSGLCEVTTAIQDGGGRLTFLFDEFETIARNPRLNPDFFSRLRNLVPAPVYVITAHRSLKDLAGTEGDVLGSPFLDLFAEIHLNPLKPEEAREMVWGLLELAEQGNPFTERDLAYVFELSSYHPFLLQLACYHLFDQKRRRKELAIADYENMRQDCIDDAEACFRYTWTNLSASERRLVNQYINRLQTVKVPEETTALIRSMLESILSGGPEFLGNFEGFVLVEITDIKENIVPLSQEGRRLLAVLTEGQIYQLRVTIQSQSQKSPEGIFYAMRLADGQDVDTVDFTVSPDCDSLRFEPASLEFTVGARWAETVTKTTQVAADREGPHSTFVLVYQKSELMQSIHLDLEVRKQ